MLYHVYCNLPFKDPIQPLWQTSNPQYSSSSGAMKTVGQREIDEESISWISDTCQKLHQINVVLKQYKHDKDKTRDNKTNNWEFWSGFCLFYLLLKIGSWYSFVRYWPWTNYLSIFNRVLLFPLFMYKLLLKNCAFNSSISKTLLHNIVLKTQLHNLVKISCSNMNSFTCKTLSHKIVIKTQNI